jgi:proton-dependent oligopeptide transporter, POT family
MDRVVGTPVSAAPDDTKGGHPSSPPPKQLFGQPRGLATLFLTEMWERFSYYGARAILVLFMTAAVARGGLGLTDKSASAVYGLFLAGGYFSGLFGGWIADRLIGPQRSVIAGGAFIMVGNGMMASGSNTMFFVGLLVAMLGVGLLKPNVSSIVGQLYPEGGSRRDAGFSIFYMGINTGSAFGSTLVPICAAHFGWHAGFALPAIGMLFGLIQFIATRHYLGAHGRERAPDSTRGSWTPVIVLAVALIVVTGLALNGTLAVDATAISNAATWLMTILAVGYFAYLVFFAGLEGAERSRVYVMIALFVASATFWAGYEQMGASFNLFADRYTERHFLGMDIPAGVLQGVNPVFIIVFAPILAAVWLGLGRRNLDFSPPFKFALGLLFMGSGFLVMYVASLHVIAGTKVLPTWLIFTYLCHTLGELCLSPVGLSSMTKLAPPRFVGQVMGLWFLSMALGGNLAGQLSGEYDSSNLESLPGLFLKIFWWGAIGGGVMLVLTPWLRRQMAGAH